MAKLKAHFSAPKLVSGHHEAAVHLIGCGGTGSHIIGHLARMNIAIKELGGKGLMLTVWDNKKVTDINPVRQLFSPIDEGKYKSEVMINRVNRFYGLNWEYRTERWIGGTKGHWDPELLISCVDSVTSRKDIFQSTNKRPNSYVLDIGNAKDFGQVILSVKDIEQPKSQYKTVSTLKNIFQIHKKVEPLPDTDSCNIFDSINAQGLMTNSIMAAYGAELLWKFFNEKVLTYHGAYINLKTMRTMPIPI